MADEKLTELLMLVTKVAERQESILHRLNNIDLRTDGFVPRREIDDRFETLKEFIAKDFEAMRDTHGGRLDVIEGNLGKAAWAIITAWFAAMGAVATAFMKFKNALLPPAAVIAVALHNTPVATGPPRVPGGTELCNLSSPSKLEN